MAMIPWKFAQIGTWSHGARQGWRIAQWPVIRWTRQAGYGTCPWSLRYVRILPWNMSPENQWLEDVPLSRGHVSFRGCRYQTQQMQMRICTQCLANEIMKGAIILTSSISHWSLISSKPRLHKLYIKICTNDPGPRFPTSPRYTVYINT